MSVLLVGGFDPASGAMVLFGFSSSNGFEPRLVGMPCIGGRPQDEELASRLLKRAVAHGGEGVADACRLALQEVAKVNPEIGPPATL
jgi:hypothetical protein